MKERREYQRFQLELPAKVEMISSRTNEIFELKTKNISAAGAFLHTREQLPEGTRCRVEMTVPNEKIKKLTGALSLIKIEGVLVRTTPTGVAICFDGECQILSLKET